NPHNHLGDLPAVKLQENDDVTEEAVWTSAHDGHWPADYVGLLFLLPITTLYVSGVLNTVLSSEHQKEILRYIYNHQGHSTMLSSALNYVALRLLGESPNGGDGAMEKSRKWILDHGGATFTAAWGKFWLTVLGVYDWSGVNPVPPEFWLLPYYLPFHPGRMSCYCRMVYLPMSYIYGRRFVGPITPLVMELRKELYTDAYDEIDWNKARTECAKEDMYNPHSLVLGISWTILHKFEPIMFHWPWRKLRNKALAFIMRHIHYEDESTHYINMGAVPKALSMLACWIEDPDSEAFKCHIARVPDYLWIAKDGMKMQVTNDLNHNSLATGLVKELGSTLQRAHAFIKNSHLLENCPGDLNYWYRRICKGGWTFTTADDGWLWRNRPDYSSLRAQAGSHSTVQPGGRVDGQVKPATISSKQPSPSIPWQQNRAHCLGIQCSTDPGCR
ncbi:hypothetical protein ACJX0J_027136, partial [Zea mays]